MLDSVILFKLNGTRKHEWIVRHSVNMAANYSRNRQSVFVNEVLVPFAVVGGEGGIHRNVLLQQGVFVQAEF